MTNLSYTTEKNKNLHEIPPNDLFEALKHACPALLTDLQKLERRVPPAKYNPFTEFSKVKVGREQLERSVVTPDKGDQLHFVCDFTTRNILAEQAKKDGMTTDEMYRWAMWLLADLINNGNIKVLSVDYAHAYKRA